MPQNQTRARRLLLTGDAFHLDHDGVLYRINDSKKRNTKELPTHLVIPRALKHQMLTSAHDDLTGGHLGIFKTYQKLKERYFWDRMYKDVEHWVRSCVDCATRKTPKNRLRAPLLPLPVEGVLIG